MIVRRCIWCEKYYISVARKRWVGQQKAGLSYYPNYTHTCRKYTSRILSVLFANNIIKGTMASASATFFNFLSGVFRNNIEIILYQYV